MFSRALAAPRGRCRPAVRLALEVAVGIAVYLPCWRWRAGDAFAELKTFRRRREARLASPSSRRHEDGPLLGRGGLALGASGCGARETLAPQPKAAAASKSPFAGHELRGPLTAADFALRDQHGRLIRLSAQRGKLVLITFLYTHCTDICPLIADQLNQALREMYHQRSSVRVLAVSVDPVGDTPPAVRAYVREHRLLPEFHYLTGTRAQLAKVWQAYNVLVLQRNPESVGHSGYIYLLDRSGKPRVFYGAKATPDQVAHDLRALLRSAAR